MIYGIIVLISSKKGTDLVELEEKKKLIYCVYEEIVSQRGGNHYIILGVWGLDQGLDLVLEESLS